MRPETIKRWADECHLSPQERKALELLSQKDGATTAELVDHIYLDRLSGGPLTADWCVRQRIGSLRRKLWGRASIPFVGRYVLEIHPRREVL